jgi:hypothetical protein
VLFLRIATPDPTVAGQVLQLRDTEAISDVPKQCGGRLNEHRSCLGELIQRRHRLGLALPASTLYLTLHPARLLGIQNASAADDRGIDDCTTTA